MRGWGTHQKINAARPSSPFIPLHPFLRGVYPLLTINSPKKFKMVATYYYPEKISTASPFVATFPGTNLLVVVVVLLKNKKIGLMISVVIKSSRSE